MYRGKGIAKALASASINAAKRSELSRARLVPRSVRMRIIPIPCSAKNGSTRSFNKSAAVIGVLVV